MGDATTIVLDASVGVKWFRSEAGSDAAVGLLAEHAAGEAEIAVPSLFLYEVMSVAIRWLGPQEARGVWRDIEDSGFTIYGVGTALVASALDVVEEHGCDFYDAQAPALARVLGAPFFSADRRAHGDIPGATIIG
ncbi:MAG: type II toxin-antitoxin system VapC family toxin [Actinomycetota bacterium]|jgi:predicted nucleic acid-binding protein|nr:type II toxin-antitoxin system VapC family toxin [Actinomycetota bacterium]